MVYNEAKQKFSVTKYVEEFRKQDVGRFTEPLSQFNYVDNAMSGFDELKNERLQVPDSPTRYNSSPESDSAEFRDVQVNPRDTKSRRRAPEAQTRVIPSVLPKRILTQRNEKTNSKVENTSPPSTSINSDSVAWLKGEYSNPKTSVAKRYPSEFTSDPRKLELINIIDTPESDDSSRA